MKFGKIGIREFIPFPYDDVTIENLIKACNTFYQEQNKVCDILATEFGPPCSRVDQIANFNVIYVRFLDVQRHSEKTHNIPPIPPPAKKMKLYSEKPKSSSVHTLQNQPSCHVAKSVSALEMMQMGRFQQPTEERAFTYNMEEFVDTKWVNMGPVTFHVDEQPIGEGGFRLAYKCSSYHWKFPGKWVLKKYKSRGIANIELAKETVDMQARKLVQMNTLVRKLAYKFCNLYNDENLITYNKVFLGELSHQKEDISENVVVLEIFLPGTFVKYINNDGTIMDVQESVGSNMDVNVLQTMEAFVHFSYIKYEKKLMVLDIQGTGTFAIPR